MKRPGAPLYILAADHRWQWHDWCDAHARPHEIIPELKSIAVDGFLAARERSPDVRSKGAMLLDEQYSSSLIASLRAQDVAVAARVVELARQKGVGTELPI